ncbi:unnamed protein product [Adineta steineri]|uniref:Uncharacterized protein n=1 Tax=Adineta steineri TaxID=433720 RepID=A0A819JYT9_9BILA|nr:unnamed protein product [Adineta steineri]
MMAEYGSKLFDKISISKILFIFLFKLKIVSSISNQSCYTCIEPLVGYTDHMDSCRYFNTTSPMGLSYIKDCKNPNDNYIGEYECRKLVISYRSIETYLRRDCVPKGLCSWKDKTQSMMNTPVHNCVYTDDAEQKLECIYCCDTPLCNRSISYYTIKSIYILVIIYALLENISFMDK